MFNLTQEERKAIIFFLSILLLGAALNYACKRNTKARAIACLPEDFSKIDLNRADKELLLSVEGIGEKTASKILEYRAQNKRIFSVEELKNLKGMTEYRFNKIKDGLYVK